MLDATHEPAFRSLDRSFTPQVPVGADLGQALGHLLGQALAHQFPDHPHFEREVKRADCEKAADKAGVKFSAWIRERLLRAAKRELKK